jgi:anti-sigma regulatory factor (Ser/Thr protein kinase)
VFTRHRILELEAAPSSARRARQFFRNAAGQCHLAPEQIRRGELAVSELVTNAVLYAQGPIRLRAARGKPGMRVEVSDGDPRAPHMGDPTPDRAGSRGLPIVAAVAAEWGWDSEADEPGKRVWFTLPTQDDAPAEA